MVWVVVCVIAALAIIPIVYSYFIYKQHQKEGIVYAEAPKSGAEKIALKNSKKSNNNLFILQYY